MADFILPLFFLCALLFVGATSSNEEISPMGYWNKLLPKTPVPMSLRAFVPTGFGDLSQGKYATNLRPDLCPLYWLYHNYDHGTTLDKMKGDHEVNSLFLEENLKPGSRTKKLDFVKTQETSGWPTLLPRREAQAFPFSSSKLARILKRFSMDPNSADASIMKQTLENCEKEAYKGETRYCVTSLESMVDFAVSQLKTNNVQLLTYSFVNKEEKESKSRVYTVQPGVVEMASPQAVVCHAEPYPYAVFYCHRTTNTKSYILPLVAEEDGTRVMAGAVCHTDTSSWNPNHASMLVLGIKPGTPVCHFLTHGHFVFVPNFAA